MSEIKWIKLSTDIFNNRKIRQIESMPDSDAILVIWFKILALSGTINESGMLMITKDIPYTDEMLANQFGRPVNTVRLALKTFEKFGMLEVTDNIFRVSNWEKYQNVEELEKIREQTRKRVAKHREKQRLLECNVTSNGNVTRGNATDKDIDKDIDIDKEYIDKRVTFNGVLDAYHSLCPSYPKVKVLSDARKKAIKARLNYYSMEDLEEAFRKAEASDFLKGKNDRNWQANFDWIMKDRNLAKILDGNYDNRQSAVESRVSAVDDW